MHHQAAADSGSQRDGQDWKPRLFVNPVPGMETQKDERLIPLWEEPQDRAEANFLGVGGESERPFLKITERIRLMENGFGRREVFACNVTFAWRGVREAGGGSFGTMDRIRYGRPRSIPTSD